MPSVPIPETERLVMRGSELSDFEPYVVMRQHPAFYRYLSREAPNAEDTWNMLLRNVAHWELMGFGYWAVEEKGSGRFIGAVGYADNKRTLPPDFTTAHEIGWLLAPPTHGQGYASEAVAAAIKWGDAHFKQARTVCIIHPDNQASLRVAAKFDYQEYHGGIYKEAPVVLCERIVRA